MKEERHFQMMANLSSPKHVRYVLLREYRLVYTNIVQRDELVSSQVTAERCRVHIMFLK